jgi:hypothetical protein
VQSVLLTVIDSDSYFTSGFDGFVCSLMEVSLLVPAGHRMVCLPFV